MTFVHSFTANDNPLRLSDALWAAIEPLMPAPQGRGRPPTTSPRAAVEAILFLTTTGTPWRLLPPCVYPPRSTVYDIYRHLRDRGAWPRIQETYLAETARSLEARGAAKIIALADDRRFSPSVSRA